MNAIRLLIFILFVSSYNFSVAQVTYEIEFENGEKRNLEVFYDDPAKKPDLVIALSPLSFTVGGGGGLAFSGFSSYDLDEKTTISGSFLTPFNLDTDGYGVSDYSEDAGKYFETELGISYALLSKNKIVKRKVNVGRGSDNRGNAVVYRAKIPRNFGYVVNANSGVQYLNRMFGTPVRASSPSDELRYFIRDGSSVAVKMGLSLLRKEASSIEVRETSGQWWKQKELSLNFYINTQTSETIISEDEFYNRTEVTSGFTSIALSPVYWRLSYRVVGGKLKKNTAFGKYFEIEIGTTPKYAVEEPEFEVNGILYAEPIIDYSFAAIKVGLTIGK